MRGSSPPGAREMATSDGISGEDWDVIHGLAVELVNAVDGDDEPACRAKLMQYLDRLEAKDGELPSILATRADYTQEAETKERLLRRAYDLAELRGDAQNCLHVAHSLADLYIEERRDPQAGSPWLERLRLHARKAEDRFYVEESGRLRAQLEQLD